MRILSIFLIRLIPAPAASLDDQGAPTSSRAQLRALMVPRMSWGLWLILRLPQVTPPMAQLWPPPRPPGHGHGLGGGRFVYSLSTLVACASCLGFPCKVQVDMSSSRPTGPLGPHPPLAAKPSFCVPFQATGSQA